MRKTKLRKTLDKQGRKINYLVGAGLPEHRVYRITQTGIARPAEQNRIAKLLKKPKSKLF